MLMRGKSGAAREGLPLQRQISGGDTSQPLLNASVCQAEGVDQFTQAGRSLISLPLHSLVLGTFILFSIWKGNIF